MSQIPGEVVGIEQDFEFVHGTTDGWILWLNDLVSESLGKAAATDFTVRFVQIDDRTVARIDVGLAPKPVFARTLKGEKSEKFVARINSATIELAGQEMLDYQKKRWPQ